MIQQRKLFLASTKEWGADHEERYLSLHCNFVLEIPNRKDEGLIADSVHQQIFTFKDIIGHEHP